MSFHSRNRRTVAAGENPRFGAHTGGIKVVNNELGIAVVDEAEITADIAAGDFDIAEVVAFSVTEIFCSAEGSLPSFFAVGRRLAITGEKQRGGENNG